MSDDKQGDDPGKGQQVPDATSEAEEELLVDDLEAREQQASQVKGGVGYP